ncbi:MAG: hypothetical protein RR782_02555 [Clostridium sp.]
MVKFIQNIIELFKCISKGIENRKLDKMCEHDFKTYTENTKFRALNGEMRYVLCSKCGREKDSYYHYYD